LDPTPTSDIYIVGIDDFGIPYAYDYYNHDFLSLCMDDDIGRNGTNSIIGFNGFEANGVTTVKFQRMMRTGSFLSFAFLLKIGRSFPCVCA